MESMNAVRKRWRWSIRSPGDRDHALDDRGHDPQAAAGADLQAHLGQGDLARFRRLEKIGIPRPYVVDAALRRGVVHRTEDGRYWVDVERNRRFRRKVALIAGAVALVLAAGGWWLVATALEGNGGVS
jgi:hypothetical protein